MQEKLDRLPDSELDVMLVLWSFSRPMKPSEIHEILTTEYKKDWSISTVQALLARLSDRGFIQAEKEGRLKFYTPVVSEASYREKETRTFLQRLHGNSYKSLLATLVQSHEINEEDIDEIAEIIRKAGKDHA